MRSEDHVIKSLKIEDENIKVGFDDLDNGGLRLQPRNSSWKDPGRLLRSLRGDPSYLLLTISHLLNKQTNIEQLTDGSHARCLF